MTKPNIAKLIKPPKTVLNRVSPNVLSCTSAEMKSIERIMLRVFSSICTWYKIIVYYDDDNDVNDNMLKKIEDINEGKFEINAENDDET